MASFLDTTSGDITLDAVLTDYGRQLLAKGDGSFNIVKFAFGDDEIDYSLYEATASSPNQDTKLMATPILQAFTNNAASLKSKLLTLNIDNLLFLPVLKLNTLPQVGTQTATFNSLYTGYVLPVEKTDETTNKLKIGQNIANGVLVGTKNKIRVDQGLDSTDTSNAITLQNTALYETEYDIFVDSTYVSLANITPNSVDDDGIAVYRLSGLALQPKPTGGTDPNDSPIQGTRGSYVEFILVPNPILLSTTTYFDKYGSSLQLISGTSFKTLKLPIRVVGVTTGYAIDLSVLIARYV